MLKKFYPKKSYLERTIEALSMISSLLDLFLPPYCVVCNRALHPWEDFLCLSCSLQLPETRYHQWQDNPMRLHLLEVFTVHQATALFFYEMDGATAQLIHQMKYNNQKKIGHYCGYRLGLQLESFSSFKVIDAVIPVPLHPKRERKRGYNQVFAFAQSLANCLNAQFYPTALKRIRHTPYLAQTTAEERHQIIANAFELHPAMHNSKPQHFLLVDDVMTTGATLIACGRALNCEQKNRLSIATIAYRQS